MDSDDIKAFVLIVFMVLLSILALVLPLVICLEKKGEREFELEKYKIEMQMKHGDIVKESSNGK